MSCFTFNLHHSNEIIKFRTLWTFWIDLIRTFSSSTETQFNIQFARQYQMNCVKLNVAHANKFPNGICMHIAISMRLIEFSLQIIDMKTKMEAILPSTEVDFENFLIKIIDFVFYTMKRCQGNLISWLQHFRLTFKRLWSQLGLLIMNRQSSTMYIVHI